MSGWERFEALARLAAAEPTPLPDVRAAVLYRLRVAAAPVPWWQNAWLGACAVAACALMVMCWQSYQALGNPYLGWLGVSEGGWLL